MKKKNEVVIHKAWAGSNTPGMVYVECQTDETPKAQTTTRWENVTCEDCRLRIPVPG